MQSVAKKRKMPAQTGEFVKEDQLDDEYIKQISDISYKPVFILGLHRSGTSILYKMLHSTDYFNGLTAYDVVYYNRLLYNKKHGLEEEFKQRFNNLIKKTGQQNRDIDKIKMNADFAIEYSFLLGPPYLFQRINKKNIDLFDMVCKKIQLVKSEKNRLLLKNPWDFPNFLSIKEKIPQSKFIFIHRHPLDIMNSSMNALRVIINKETVYSEIFSPFAKKIDENPLLQWVLQSLLIPQLPVGLSLLTENRVRYTKKFLTDIKKLDKKSFINIKYEDLCTHTSATMKKVFNHLQLESVDSKQFEDFIQPRNLSYSPEIYHMKPYILNRFKKYCTFFNYQ
jgi:hypothetical protein